jgi:hypothetical protein
MSLKGVKSDACGRHFTRGKWFIFRNQNLKVRFARLKFSRIWDWTVEGAASGSEGSFAHLSSSEMRARLQGFSRLSILSTTRLTVSNLPEFISQFFLASPPF